MKSVTEYGNKLESLCTPQQKETLTHNRVPVSNRCGNALQGIIIYLLTAIGFTLIGSINSIVSKAAKPVTQAFGQIKVCQGQPSWFDPCLSFCKIEFYEFSATLQK
jgi:hypothetical protein